MAVIALATRTENGAFVAEWSVLGAGDTGEPWGLAGQTDKTVTIDGAGGSFSLQGSNGGAYYTLHNFDAADTEITTDGIYVIKESPLFIRPSGEVDSVIINAR